MPEYEATLLRAMRELRAERRDRAAQAKKERGGLVQKREDLHKFCALRYLATWPSQARGPRTSFRVPRAWCLPASRRFCGILPVQFEPPYFCRGDRNEKLKHVHPSGRLQYYEMVGCPTKFRAACADLCTGRRFLGLGVVRWLFV